MPASDTLSEPPMSTQQGLYNLAPEMTGMIFERVGYGSQARSQLFFKKQLPDGTITSEIPTLVRVPRFSADQNSLARASKHMYAIGSGLPDTRTSFYITPSTIRQAFGLDAKVDLCSYFQDDTSNATELLSSPGSRLDANTWIQPVYAFDYTDKEGYARLMQDIRELKAFYTFMAINVRQENSICQQLKDIVLSNIVEGEGQNEICVGDFKEVERSLHAIATQREAEVHHVDTERTLSRARIWEAPLDGRTSSYSSHITPRFLSADQSSSSPDDASRPVSFRLFLRPGEDGRLVSPGAARFDYSLPRSYQSGAFPAGSDITLHVPTGVPGSERMQEDLWSALASTGLVGRLDEKDVSFAVCTYDDYIKTKKTSE